MSWQTMPSRADAVVQAVEVRVESSSSRRRGMTPLNLRKNGFNAPSAAERQRMRNRGAPL